MTAPETRKQRGVAAVEFALIAPIVFLLLFGIVEFGLALWRKQVLTSAVREAARQGVVATNPRKTIGQIQGVVGKYLADVGWDSGLANTSVSAACTTAGGTQLVVSATYPTSLLIVSRLMPGTFTVDGNGNLSLSASVTMQCE